MTFHQPLNTPIQLKPGLAPRLLALKQFRSMTIVDAVLAARKVMGFYRGFPINDKATAIAVLLGTEELP